MDLMFFNDFFGGFLLFQGFVELRSYFLWDFSLGVENIGLEILEVQFVFIY